MKICKVKGCYKKHHCHGYCGKHYMQYMRYGKILKRTIFDKNEIVLKDDYAEIIMYNRDNKETGRAKIDLGDVDEIKKYKWYLMNNGYSNTRGKGKILGMHRLLMGSLLKANDKLVDHKNGDTLDNRRNNLRACSRQENNRNNKKALGISWHKQRGKWRAHITIDSKMIHLGSFKEKEEALKIRRLAELKYFGKFAK